MAWYRWWSSRLYCPKYIIQCIYDKETSQYSLLDWWVFSYIFWGMRDNFWNSHFFTYELFFR